MRHTGTRAFAAAVAGNPNDLPRKVAAAEYSIGGRLGLVNGVVAEVKPQAGAIAHARV